MANHAPKIDPVSKIVFLVSLLAIVAVVYVLLSNLISTYKRNSIKGEIDNTQLIMTTEENLKPIGVSSTSDAPAVSAAGRGGKEIYDAVCTSCHATGVLDSPKLGDNAAWAARAKDGLAAMLTTATNGKGAMPAKGGDPSLTDSEIKAVVLYMTKESGLDLGSAEPAPSKEAPKEDVKTEAEEAPVVVSTETAEVIAPKAPAVPVAPVVAAAPVAPSIDGKKVYDSACFACHASGVAGSPKLGDKDAWAPRIATGIDALYGVSLTGKGAMPAKGGNMSLSDADVKAAVDYMVNQSK
ncbi:MAG: c-type cytochrome [Cocleimonas sp.]